MTASGGDLADLDAEVTLSFAAEQDIADTIGNALSETEPTGTNDNTYVVDNTAPTVASIERQTPESSPTNANTLTWRVTFSEAVTDVGTADFAVTGTTGTVTAVTEVADLETQHDVTASGGDLADLDATVTLSFATAQDIADAAGNALSETAPTGTNDNDYEVDNTAPTVEITGVPEESSAAFTATFTFSEAVNGFAVEDIAVGNGAASVFTGTDGDTDYTALITPAASGAVTVDVAADVAADDAGNGNAVAQATSTYTAPGPTVASIERQTPASSPTNANTLTWRVTFSETVSNVDAADFAVSGTTGTVTAVAAVTGTNAHDVTASGGDLADLDATVTLSFAAAQDIADGDGAALSSTTPTGTNDNDYVVDNTAPTVEATSAVEVAGPTVTVTWSEALDKGSIPSGAGGFSLRFASGTPPAVTAVSVSGMETVLTLASAVADGTQGVTLDYTPQAATPVRDAAGNPAADFTGRAATVTPDTRAPEVSGTPTVDGTTLTVTFDEALDPDSIPAAPGGFTVTVTRGGSTESGFSVSGIALDGAGTVLTLTLNRAVRGGDAVVLGYAPPSTNPLRDRAAAPNDVAAFTTGQDGVEAVDNRTPSVRTVAFVDAAAALAIDGKVEIDVTFTEAVRVTTSSTARPQIGVLIGTETRQARYVSGTGNTTLRFEYAVAQGDEDTDGIAIAADALTTPSGSSIRTQAGNRAVQVGHDAVAAEAARTVDGTRPTVSSAAAEGLTVTVTWSEAIDPASGRSDAGGFVLRYGGSARPAVTAVAVDGTDGKTMRLTMDAAIPDGTQDATLAWAPPRAGVPVRDVAGNEPERFDEHPKWKDVSVTPDTAAPTLTGAEIRGRVLALTFSEPLDGTSTPAAGQFTVTVTRNGNTEAGHTVGTVAVAGSGVRLTLAKGVLPGDTVVLAYTKPSSNPLRDLAATPNEAAAFTTGQNNGTYDVPAVDNRTAALEVALSKASVTEGDDRTAVLSVTVAGGGTAGADRAIAVAVSGTPTAKETEDWTLETKSRTLAAGGRSARFPVTVVDDARLEAGESVVFAVTADGAAIGSVTLTVADDDRAVLRVVGPEDGAREGGAAFTLKLRLDPHPDNGPPIAGDACFLDFAVAAQLSVTENGSELSGTPALPQDVDFSATSFEDCTREATADLSTRASDGEWMAPRTVLFSLAPKSSADERVDAGSAEVTVRDDTAPPGPLVTGIAISPEPPEASDDYKPSRNREEFKEVPGEVVHGPGTVLKFTLTFDKAVTVAGGRPELVLDVFGRERRATLPESADLTDVGSLTFEWRVEKGDNDPDGIEIGGIDLKGAEIRLAADCQVNCVMDLPTFVRQHGERRAAHRVRGGFHIIEFVIGEGKEQMNSGVREGDLYRVQVIRKGGAYDEHALATVWMKDSVREDGELIGVQFWPAGPQGIGREPRNGHTAWVAVPVPGDGKPDAERTLTFRLSGTDSGRNWYDPDPDGPTEKVVKVADAGIAKDGPMLSVGPATVREPATGTAPLRFRVCLWPEKGCPPAPGQNSAFDAYEGVGHEVRVWYRTLDGTATEGADYRATSGMLVFAPGETAKTVEVPVLADAHDEGVETVWLEIYNPVGAEIARGRNVGDIRNDGPIPQAWIARFGRTVAEQVLDAVESRMRAPRTPGAEVSFAGRRLGLDPIFGADATPDDGDAAKAKRAREAEEEQRPLAAWLWDAAEEEERPGLETRTMTQRELLLGSSFLMTAEPGDGAPGAVSLWGRAAVSRFDGREDGLTVDGEVESGLLGADWSRVRNTLGLILSHSRGEGGYSGEASSGTVSSTLTGLYPWGRHALNERVSLWGVAGYGAGTLTLTPENDDGTPQAAIRTDMDLAMGAVGLRGVVVEAPADGGPELAVKTDALAVRTSSDAVRGSGDGAGNLSAAQGDVTRLRLGIEGTWRKLMIGTGTLAPRLEVGARHDGGDAETGMGTDIGGGLAWSDPETGVRAEMSGRGLLTHESAGFRQRGIAGSFGWNPTPGSNRGPNLSITQTMGLSATGGADALLGRTTLEGLAADDDGDELEKRRFETRLGYGLSAFGDRFTWTPESGFGVSATQRDYSLGWRLIRDPRPGDIGSLELSMEAERHESANDNAPPEHTVGLKLTTRW